MATSTSTLAASAGYRPDIDGLRAIAVLVVVLFHFEVDAFAGGFVGVDVFFVISGFLITRLIRHDVDAGRFSFGVFYIRRVRRLFPALFVTIVATFIAASVLFTPLHLERLGGSALHALLSVSNFYFWTESGYFDAASTLKPLLHFWSLSVEEQFYLVWPALLVALLTRTRSRVALGVFIVAAGLASLLLSIRWTEADAATAFYLAPARIVEFAIGAILVWCVDFKPKANIWLEILLATGLALVLYSVFTFDETTKFPSWSVLVPCVGTGLAIYAGEARYLGGMLGSRVPVFIGLISYSLYLCHWPIFVFYRYTHPNLEIETVHVVALVVVSSAVAIGMRHFVETPFRFSSSQLAVAGVSPRFGLTCALLSLVMTFPAAHSWANRGWVWRYSSESQNLAQLFDLDLRRTESIRFQQEHVLSAGFTSARERVLVVGDSHARDVSNGLAQVLPKDRFEVRAERLDDRCYAFIPVDGSHRIGNPKDITADCRKSLDQYVGSIKVRLADIILVSANFNEESASLLTRLLHLTRNIAQNKQVRIVVLDRAVMFTAFHPIAIRMLSDGMSVEQVNRASFKYTKHPIYGKVFDVLKLQADSFEGVSVISKRLLVCEGGRCDFFLEDGTLAIWDSTHWTVSGAREFMARLVEREPEVFE